MKKPSLKIGVSLLLLFLLLFAPPRISAEGTRCQWADELKGIILSQIKEHGLVIDTEAEGLLNRVVDSGARRMEQDHFDDASIRKARKGAEDLGREIVKQVESAQGPLPASTLRLVEDKHREVKKSHILAALKKLCPLYPFCE